MNLISSLRDNENHKTEKVIEDITSETEKTLMIKEEYYERKK